MNHCPDGLYGVVRVHFLLSVHIYVALSAVLGIGDTKMIAFTLRLYIQHPFSKYSLYLVCAR